MADDDDLLARFNALRAPTSILPARASPADHVANSAKRAEDEDSALQAIADGEVVDPSVLGLPHHGREADDDLARRVQLLRGGAPPGMHAQEEDADAVIGDDQVEAYLATYTPDETPLGEGEADVAKQARDALRSAGLESGTAPGQSDHDDENSEGQAEEGHDDFETEDEIVARALAEASLEGNEDAEPRDMPFSEEAPDALSFPSLPTHEPKPDEVDEGDGSGALDEDVQKRMDLLLGLSGPTARPGLSLPRPPTEIKREAGQGWNLPGYNDARDVDIDSWCCICNKDAELQCVGCDNDLYCTECWTDGHEHEKHRVKQFNWKGRQALGA